MVVQCHSLHKSIAGTFSYLRNQSEFDGKAIMSALLSTGLHYNCLLLHIYYSKVQSTSKSVLNDETDSLSTTSFKCVDGVTKSALLKQLAITDGENKSQEFLAITIRGTKKILVTSG